MATRLEDFPTELFFSIFDYFWAHELFYSFSNLNERIDELILHTQLHISSENQNITYSPHYVLSLTLTSSPICLEEFTNLRSLTLIKCNFDNLIQFPPHISRLCIQNIDLPNSNIKLIFENPTLINVQLNLHHKLSFFPSILNIDKNFSNIEYLTINYISLNDIIELLQYTSKLKYLHISLFGINKQNITNFSSIPTVTRVICLSMGISFDILCTQFLAIYFPNIQNLSIFTSYVDKNLFIHVLEQLLMDNLHFVKKLNVSAQFIINRTLTNNNDNIEAISIRFRTAFWIKRNCRATFKCCNDDPHIIRLYLQTTKKTRARPSRFLS
ncbi:unnamed protein product [Rotaria sp. Silwood2]|nr:unnamed protein product [Rotaria sp. Silwood2]CAF3073903.1 unnamed protein product [Rotaria sp. Silwood2]CAF4095899.1 unnamed protein product [Rotaria sp. Silwood2]CAF4147471.1 unnamed protein product [Rotaria sp. Silwood2]